MPKWSFTLADFPELVRPIMAKAGGDPTNPLTPVIAPCCGRRTAADTIVDCRSIEGTLVAAGGRRAPKDHDWLCDGCLHRMYRDATNAWTRSLLLEKRGAPAELVTTHRGREWADDAIREYSKRGEEYQPDELRGLMAEQVDLLHFREAQAAAGQLSEVA